MQYNFIIFFLLLKLVLFIFCKKSLQAADKTKQNSMVSYGSCNPLQYSCLENPVDGGAWCRLLSMGSQRVGHDWAISLHFSFSFTSYVWIYTLFHRHYSWGRSLVTKGMDCFWLLSFSATCTHLDTLLGKLGNESTIDERRKKNRV